MSEKKRPGLWGSSTMYVKGATFMKSFYKDNSWASQFEMLRAMRREFDMLYTDEEMAKWMNDLLAQYNFIKRALEHPNAPENEEIDKGWVQRHWPIYSDIKKAIALSQNRSGVQSFTKPTSLALKIKTYSKDKPIEDSYDTPPQTNSVTSSDPSDEDTNDNDEVTTDMLSDQTEEEHSNTTTEDSSSSASSSTSLPSPAEAENGTEVEKDSEVEEQATEEQTTGETSDGVNSATIAFQQHVELSASERRDDETMRCDDEPSASVETKDNSKCEEVQERILAEISKARIEELKLRLNYDLDMKKLDDKQEEREYEIKRRKMEQHIEIQKLRLEIKLEKYKYLNRHCVRT